MANKIPRVPVREQDPKVRATNFEEVCYGYDLEEATLEASRCLQCKNPRCVAACPVNIRIPDFIGALHRGELQQAADIIAEDSSLPSICGRVCPQESQCEGSCILGIKSEPVAIGKLERFVGDWKLEHGAAAHRTAPRNGRRVAVIGSGPAGLACASDLAKMGYGVKIFEALHKVGGVLVYGIPEFRLPKQRIVAREIAEVERLGVEIETDVIVGRTVTVDSLLGEEGYDAVFIGSGAGDASGKTSTRRGAEYTFRVSRKDGTPYDVSASVNGVTVKCTYDSKKDIYRIPGSAVTGDITVTVTKGAPVEVSTYVTLDNQSMYLVIYTGNVEDGHVPMYDGQNMYWSKVYNAYAWLVISSADEKEIVETARNSITIGEGKAAAAVDYSGNVDLSGRIDVDDVHLAHDVYNARYTLVSLMMHKFLNGDVNGDRKVDIRDSVWIVNRILREK